MSHTTQTELLEEEKLRTDFEKRNAENLKNPQGMELFEEIMMGDCQYITRVPGGWVFSQTEVNGDEGCSVALCFIPYSNDKGGIQK